jgi:hypothetical protein
MEKQLPFPPSIYRSSALPISLVRKATKHLEEERTPLSDNPASYAYAEHLNLQCRTSANAAVGKTPENHSQDVDWIEEKSRKNRLRCCTPKR